MTSTLIRPVSVMPIKRVSDSDILAKWKKLEAINQKPLVFYSSEIGGVTESTHLFRAPVDDHLFHRGDGVFEAFRAIDGRVLLLDAHLERLVRSSQAIGLELPLSPEEFKTLVFECASMAARPDLEFRLYVSRGAGSLSVDPALTHGPLVYLIILEGQAQDLPLRPLSCGLDHENSMKAEPWVQIKSCNYLPNALSKLRAHQRGVDILISCNSDGSIGEGPTENLFIKTNDGWLLSPPQSHALRGTTLEALIKLVNQDPDRFQVNGFRAQSLAWNDFLEATSRYVVGTTHLVREIALVENEPVSTEPSWHMHTFRAFREELIRSGTSFL